MDDDRRIWQKATLVNSLMTAEKVKSLTFSVGRVFSSQPGQYCDLRVRTDEGAVFERSYSIAEVSEGENTLQFGVELIEGGEVSPHLFALKEGDQIEIRGPFGDHFLLNASESAPVCFIGGGTGVVPFVNMLRSVQKGREEKRRDILFLISAKSEKHLPYKEVLTTLANMDLGIRGAYTFTESKSENIRSYDRRIDEVMLKDVFGENLKSGSIFYICGSTPFVEQVTDLLVCLGSNPHDIKTEHFGG